MTKEKEKTTYTELERVQDQLLISNFMSLKNQQRAVQAEAQLVTTALVQNQQAAQAAEKRLLAWQKEQNDTKQ